MIKKISVYSFLLIFLVDISVSAGSLMENFAGFSGNWLRSGCVEPDWCNSMDINTDGFVNYDDLLSFLDDWMAEDIEDIVWVAIDKEGFSGEISKYETTNLQYCNYLNQALAAGLIKVHANGYVYSSDDETCSFAYFSTTCASAESQISFDAGQGTFTVVTRDQYDMANHPVSCLSWYGATAFCDFYNYRLPTDSEWIAVADFDNNYYGSVVNIFGCGYDINPFVANYDSANPLGLSSQPYTTAVDMYPEYGYGLCDMAGNVWEWTSSVKNTSQRVTKGGGWDSGWYYCTLGTSRALNPSTLCSNLGFRVCR
jgi:formylglycine-generating enzyme required for sulfatase activity